MPLSQYSESFYQLLGTARSQRVSRGETIATTENMQGIYFVTQGFVKRFLIKNDGSIGVQGVYGPKDCFGVAELFRLLIKDYSYKGLETYYYEAISSVLVYEIDNEFLQQQLLLHQELYKDLFAISGWHALSDIWRLENQGLENARKRVAHIICFYMERYGMQTNKGWEFQVPFIQQDLADILDLSRETVSIAINDLKKLKLVKGRRKIIIPDQAALKEYASS